MKCVFFLNYRGGSGLLQYLCGCPPWFMLKGKNKEESPKGLFPSLPPILSEHVSLPHLDNKVSERRLQYDNFVIFTHIGNWWGDLVSKLVPFPYDDPSPMKWSVKELSQLGDDITFRYLIRDGRTLIDSTRYLKGGVEEEYNAEDPTDYFKALTLGFRNKARIALDCQQQLGERFQILKYEDLIADPYSFIISLTSSLGLQPDRLSIFDCVERIKQEGIGLDHSSFFNRERRTTSEWKDWELRFFLLFAGKEQSELGYV